MKSACLFVQVRAGILSLLLGLSVLGSRAEAVVAPEEKIPVVFTRKVQALEISDTLTYPARLVPKVHASILADIDGIVAQVVAPLGQKVTRKQRLMILKHTDPIYQYAPVHVGAPVQGVVSSVDVTEGSRVTRGQKLATVIDPSKVQIEIEVPAQDLASVRPGIQGELKIRGRDEAIPVQIKGLSPYVDPLSGTSTCQLEWIVEKGKESAKQPLFPPGVIAQVIFKTNQRRAISVPEQAIVYRGKNTFVRLVEDGKAKQVAVTLGKTERDRVEVLKGLTDGVELIERTSGFVADGQKISVQNPEAPEDGAAGQSPSEEGNGS